MTTRPNPSRAWRVRAKEVSAFGIVGGLAVLLELGAYQVMYDVVGMGPLISKVISTAVATTFAYFMHRHWSFSHRGSIGFRTEYTLFVILSVLSLGFGLAIIGFVHYGLGHRDVLSLQIANLVSIAVGAIFRFWAYKRWVFPADSTDRGPASSPPGD